MREMNGDEFSAMQVQSWFSLNGITPEPWEVQAVMRVQRELVRSRSETAN